MKRKDSKDEKKRNGDGAEAVEKVTVACFEEKRKQIKSF